jgi:hypothetical protein
MDIPALRQNTPKASQHLMSANLVLIALSSTLRSYVPLVLTMTPNVVLALWDTVSVVALYNKSVMTLGRVFLLLDFHATGTAL